LFDDRLFDIIMEEMMTTFGADVRTDEGSLAYNACAKIAEKLEEVYGDMDEINDNILPDRQDDAHLIEYGEERGLPYSYATYPVAKGVFSQEIEIGERFTCNDYSYEVTEKISDYTYKMVCDTEGTAANTNTGDLIPIDYIDNYQGGSITETLVAGTDDEDIELYRTKVLNTFKYLAFGGNRASYRTQIDKIEGVGGCKPKRRTTDSPWIDITVMSSDYGVPSSTLINEIQTLVDPTQNSGEGYGLAPIGHYASVSAVTSQTVNISITVSLDSGHSVETLQAAVEQSMSAYLLELRQAWEENEFNNTLVRISQIEAKILAIEGVLDVSNTKINTVADNLILDYTKIPILGEVTISV
jgi:uncharacterized phage protein gp47/JayE